MSLRVAVAATAPFGADVLERLARTSDVAVVLTRPDAPAGRGRRSTAPAAKAAADALGIRVLQPERLEPGLDLDVDVVVAVAYGVIVPAAVLAERLWLNVHPSLLPRWRGAAPVERAIMAGDAETGVTVIELVEELDAGPIAAQAAFPIEPDDDAGALYEKATPLAVDLLERVLPEPSTIPQRVEGMTYAEKIGPEDRRLDLSRPAEELVRVVRALSPHIGARAELRGRQVTVWRARVADDGSFEALEVQPEGGTRMAFDAWLRGLR